MASPTIYDLLAQQDLSELTVTNLDTAAKSTAISSTNIEFWAGIITVARAVSESRTYCHGLPIPELGAAAAEAVGDGATTEFSPTTGSGLWLVQGLLPTALVVTQNGIPISVNAGGYLQYPIYVSKVSPLAFANASGGALNAVIQYQVVSL